MTEHDQLENSVAAFVLGAGEPEETEEVRAHIQSCAQCQALAQRLTRAVEVLPLETEEVKPPERLRQRILEAAAASPRGSAAPIPIRRVLRLPRRRPQAWWSAAGLSNGYAAAVSVLAICVVGLGAWDVGLSQQANSTSAAHYSLRGSGAMQNAAATVTSFPRDRVTLVDFRGMPPPAAGRVYELWLIGSDGRPVPGAVFSPEPDGSKVVLLSRDLAGFRSIAVTSEPGPTGSAQPTESSQLVGQVA